MNVLRALKRQLGGEMVGNASLNFPAIGHGPANRAVTATVKPDGRILVCTRNRSDWRPEMDRVRAALGLPAFSSRLKVLHDVAPELERAEIGNKRVAANLWHRAAPLCGTIAERYLRRTRGITCDLPPTMRYLAPTRGYPPTLITAFALPREVGPGEMTMRGVEVCAIHQTRLNLDGTKRGKEFLGSPAGLPLVLAPWNETGCGLVIAEGPEDALSAHQATGLAAWAAGSASHLPKLVAAVPPWVEVVTILVDDNDAGQHGSAALANALRRRGLYVELRGAAGAGR